MPRIAIPFATVALLAPLALAACHPSSHSESQVLGLEAADVTPFIDIPVPLAFKEIYDPQFFIKYKTYRGPRAGLMHYSGGSDLLAVARFYEDFLPANNWKYVKVAPESGSIYLYYSKPNETLIVNIFAVKNATEVILKLVPGSAFGPGLPTDTAATASP